MKKPFLTLGTVQFGIPYGIRRSEGLRSTESVLELLRLASEIGIKHFDTAQAYGLAEERIGDASQKGVLPSNATVITKISPDISAETVDRAIQLSLARLQKQRLSVVLLHRWQHRHAEDGRIWRMLVKAQGEGRIHELGASVSTPEEAVQAAQDPQVKHLQIPCNILDWRWNECELPQIKKERPELTIYCRSVFLQGILTANAPAWPSIPGVVPDSWIEKLEAVCKKLERTHRKSLCFAYMHSLPWVDSLVVGVDNAEQLRDLISLQREPAISDEDIDWIRLQLPRAPEALLNPALWGGNA